MFKIQTFDSRFLLLGLYLLSASLLPPEQQHGGIFEGELKVLVRVPPLLLRGPAQVECGGRRSASTGGRRSSAAAPPEHRPAMTRILPRDKTTPPTHTRTHFFFKSKMKHLDFFNFIYQFRPNDLKPLWLIETFKSCLLCLLSLSGLLGEKLLFLHHFHTTGTTEHLCIV